LLRGLSPDVRRNCHFSAASHRICTYKKKKKKKKKIFRNVRVCVKKRRKKTEVE